MWSLLVLYDGEQLPFASSPRRPSLDRLHDPFSLLPGPQISLGFVSLSDGGFVANNT